MEVRPATAEDATGIAEAHIRSWQAAYVDILDPAFLQSLSVERRSAQWREILDKQESRTLVARDQSGIAGFVSFGHWRDDETALNHGEIWALYARPETWGQGIGRGLLTAAVDELLASGRSTVSLWVLAANTRAVRFYRSGGFEPVEGSAKTFELGGRFVEELCLRRRDDA
jgi:ribosomal protein S18 acetylase RimI-like enzyme